MPELIQPSQVAMDVSFLFHTQLMHIPDNRFKIKNGNQQIMNTPITIPSVLAAFFSFANFDNLRLKEKFLCNDLDCNTRLADVADGCRDNTPLYELKELLS